MSLPANLHLFDAVGVEIEYMIVDRETLDVRPVADRLFQRVLGEAGSDVEGDLVSWSNELVNHVIELKTTSPTSDLKQSCRAFQTEVNRINGELAALDCRLMPSAMHPWMNPFEEARLWPGENNEIYATFDRIFNCKGHGWSNLQSMHLNLPFAGDEEFARLHTAIRIVLPLIPALAASSPFEEGRRTGFVDNRMKHYLANSRRIPEIAGDIVPEVVLSEQEYHDRVLRPMWDAIAPYDPDERMREEWLNARGAIARFGRGSIEIRVIDSQTNPASDFRVAARVIAAVRGLVEERWSSFESQKALPQKLLVDVLHATIHAPGNFTMKDPDYLSCLGLRSQATANEVWTRIFGDPQYDLSGFEAVMLKDASASEHCVADQWLRETSVEPSRAELRQLYAKVCEELSPLPPHESHDVRG